MQKQFDFKNKSKEEIRQEMLEFLEEAIPSPPRPQSTPTDEPIEPLNNERAMSLWNQLAAPVPLNPPDWKRSRIRRLFLVSLGIPVNLDEILPASGKKKKLVLPSTKPETPVSSISGKAPPLAPPFDPVSARHKANVSALALKNMTVEELHDHIETLKVVNAQASENLTYWLARREEAVGEKESLEGVIESLVGWTERQRKGTTGIAMVPGRGKTPPPQTVKKGKKK
jgi:ribosomal protein L29